MEKDSRLRIDKELGVIDKIVHKIMSDDSKDYKVVPNPTTADADDDFGFSETTSFFQDAQGYNPETGEDDNKS